MKGPVKPERQGNDRQGNGSQTAFHSADLGSTEPTPVGSRFVYGETEAGKSSNNPENRCRTRTPQLVGSARCADPAPYQARNGLLRCTLPHHSFRPLDAGQSRAAQCLLQLDSLAPHSPAISSSAGNVRKSPRSVPEADNFNPLFVALQSVDDAIRAADHFAQIRLPKFRHRAADFWKFRHAFGARDQFITQPGRCVGMMPGHVTDNVRQISLRGRRDDYLPAHSAILALTSAIGTPSPRSSSSKPCWTA